MARDEALLHWRARGAISLSRLVLSSGEAEEPVYEAHLSRRAGFEHEPLPLADHAHDFQATPI